MKLPDHCFDHGPYISPWVIGWERFQRLLSWQPGLFSNLCQDAIELWRRPSPDSPLKMPEQAATA
jgi:hypothetical protein